MNRYPYHRYLRWLALEGESAVSICEHIAELGFIAPRLSDVEFVLRQYVHGQRTDGEGVVFDPEWRSGCDVEMFDDEEASVDRDRCFWIVEEEGVRALAQRLLLDGLSTRHVASVIKLKTNNNEITEDVVVMFRDGFWDTKNLTSLDFRNYYALAGERRPMPDVPRVPLTQAPAVVAWSNRVVPDEIELSTDDIVRGLQVDGYFRYMQAAGKVGGHMEARAWANVALKASAMQRAKKVSKRPEDMPLLKPKVMYPTGNMITMDELNAKAVADAQAAQEAEFDEPLAVDDDEEGGEG